MTRILACLALIALAACTDPNAEPDVNGSISIGPNGVRPNVGLSVGNVRIGRGGVRIGL